MTGRESPTAMLRLWTRPALVAITVGCMAFEAAPAYAAWSASANGPAAGAATIMPSGRTPTGRAGAGSVTLAWTAATLPNGAAVGGYLIRRYDATTNTLESVAGTCAGVVATTTCTDQSVPPGNWVYTDEPVLNNWTGAESPRSAQVTVS